MQRNPVASFATGRKVTAALVIEHAACGIGMRKRANDACRVASRHAVRGATRRSDEQLLAWSKTMQRGRAAVSELIASPDAVSGALNAAPYCGSVCRRSVWVRRALCGIGSNDAHLGSLEDARRGGDPKISLVCLHIIEECSELLEAENAAVR